MDIDDELRAQASKERYIVPLNWFFIGLYKVFLRIWKRR